jgi:transcriptional regulator NrdR family protein
MQCPRCNGDTDVKDSRPGTHYGSPTVHRRRQCRECGHRVSTAEMIVGLGNVQQKLAGAITAMDTAMEAMRKARASLAEVTGPRKPQE